MTRNHRWFLPVSILTLSASVQAQDYTGDLGVTFTDIGIQTAMMDAAMDTVSRSEEADPGESGASAQEHIGARFSARSSRTKANLAYFAAQARAANPSAAAELERLLASVDVVGAVSDRMRGVGLDPANTADAYAVWWIIAWSAAQGRESPEDEATFQAVSRQARAAFADTDGFARLPDADKQQFAEALMVQAVLLDSANDQARGGDAALRQQLAAQAKRGAKEMGLDLTTMTLTREGFRPRKGAAVDDSALPGAAGEERLATATTGDADGNLATYAAIAAAAGAGLGAAFLLGRGGRSG